MQCGVAEERSALGNDHVEAGAALLTQGGLPSQLVRAVEFQVTPEDATDSEGRCLAEAIRQGLGVADGLCGRTGVDSGVAGDCLGRDRFKWVERRFCDMSAILSAHLADMPDPDRIGDRVRGLRKELCL